MNQNTGTPAPAGTVPAVEVSYAERAKQRRADKFLKWPGGDYVTLFKGASMTTGRKPPYNKMVNIELAPITGPAGAEDTLTKLRNKNKKIVHRFVFSEKGYGFDDFLLFLEDLGADLSQCRPQTQDPEFLDFMAILQQLEFSPPQIKLNLSWPEDGGQFFNVRFTEIPRVFNGGNTVAAAGAVAPAPTPAPAAAAAPAAEVVYYMGDGGAVITSDRAQTQAVITAGYTGQVNINSTAWVDAAAAGFVVPPAAAATAPVAAAAAVAQPATAPAALVVEPADNTIPAETAAALGVTQAAAVAQPAAEAAEAAPTVATPAADAPAAATEAGAPVNPFG